MVLTWIVLLIAVVAAEFTIGDDYKNNFGSPKDTGSEKTFQLLGANFPDVSGAGGPDRVQGEHRDPRGPLTPARRSRTMLADVSELPHISDVNSPYANTTVDRLNKDATIGFALVKFNQEYSDLDDETVADMVETAQAIESRPLQVELGGEPILLAVGPPGPR